MGQGESQEVLPPWIPEGGGARYSPEIEFALCALSERAETFLTLNQKSVLLFLCLLLYHALCFLSIALLPLLCRFPHPHLCVPSPLLILRLVSRRCELPNFDLAGHVPVSEAAMHNDRRIARWFSRLVPSK